MKNKIRWVEVVVRNVDYHGGEEFKYTITHHTTWESFCAACCKEMKMLEGPKVFTDALTGEEIEDLGALKRADVVYCQTQFQ